jgi:phosphoribosylformylglycinamidine (FGAM) synthase PurS component
LAESLQHDCKEEEDKTFADSKMLRELLLNPVVEVLRKHRATEHADWLWAEEMKLSN